MLTRRQFGQLTLPAIAAATIGQRPVAGGQTRVNSTVSGVRLGLQSACFTFSGLGLDDIIKTMVSVGLAEIDIMSAHVEHYLGAPGVQLPGEGRPGPWTRGFREGQPRGAAAPVNQQPSGGRAAGGRGADPAVREALRRWRLDVGLDKFRAVAQKFNAAGLRLFSYNLSFNDSFSDAEIERGMEITKSLGTRIITASSPLSVLPRVATFAEKHDVVVAVHNHMEGPDHFERALSISKHIWINLDVGHFFASGHDPLAYIRAHHGRITNLHVKDRLKDAGAEMPFGKGDTPLKETLLLVQRERYDFPVCIEYVGPDGPAVELGRCFDYCKRVLSA
jgi:sugar phosphate isomerase/epimerase